MTEYTIDKALNDAVESIIKTQKHAALNAIREHKLKIVPVMRVCTDNEGEHKQGSGPVAKISKVGGFWPLFTEAHYILVVDYYGFNHANNITAHIFNALCEVDVEVLDDGTIKKGLKKPEIMVFPATLEVFGAFTPALLGMGEWMTTAKTEAAKSFAAKISTGRLDPEDNEPPQEDDPPRVKSGLPEDPEEETPRHRGGRTKR